MSATAVGKGPDADLRSRLGRRARLLAATSVAYNVVEAVVAVAAGLTAGSVALVGFGLDSVVEVSSGLIILWQFRHPMPESREQLALRVLAVSFFVLAGYVGVESLRAFGTGAAADPSTVGIGLAVASLLVMPVLSRAQRRTGRALGSNAVVADGTQTLLCSYLSGALLIGLVANAALGWWWADPIAGLVIAAVAVREGLASWRGEGCCAPVAAVDAHNGETADACRGECCGSRPGSPGSPGLDVRGQPWSGVP